MKNHRKRSWVRPQEETEIYDLLDRGKSVLAIVRETGRSSSKIYEMKNSPRTSQQLPANIVEQGLRDRCNESAHGWMEEDRFAGEYYWIEQVSVEEQPASPDDFKRIGHFISGRRKCKTTKTCWNCRTTKEASRWWDIDPYAAIYDNPPIPC